MNNNMNQLITFDIKNRKISPKETRIFYSKLIFEIKAYNSLVNIKILAS